MNPPKEPTTDEHSAAEMQQELLESCLELVFDAYDDALTDKIVEPVVFLLDCEDEIGQQIADAWLGAELVRNAVAEHQLEDPSGESTTVYARAFSLEESRREVPGVFPYLAPMFDEASPSEGFYTIAVTAGGAAAFTVPNTARPQRN